MSPNYRRSPTQRLRRIKAPPCTAGDFREALRILGWSQSRAAVELGASSEYRVSDWCRGVHRVPPYIQRHLRTLLGLGPTDPWPAYPWKRHGVVLPAGSDASDAAPT